MLVHAWGGVEVFGQRFCALPPRPQHDGASNGNLVGLVQRARASKLSIIMQPKIQPI
uniref:Uncharacterized protein n=1 Tax=Arundo donax TaxID=35708 RepID=A0A0A8Y3Q3_ARUDO